MRIPLLLAAAGLLLPSCSTSPETQDPPAGAVFVDTDDDGLPDTYVQHAHAQGEGGQDTFVDTDDDGLPDARVRR